MEGTKEVAMIKRMTRADIERIVAEARSTGVRPNLRNTNLHGLDLNGIDLQDADMWSADLRDTDLSGANMGYVDLRYAYLWDACLSYTRLSGADLRNTGLQGANLSDADLRGTNLGNANWWGGLPFQAGASGDGYMVPTPHGWRITIGCWEDKTLDDLRDLIEDRADWPEATGGERERRRPMLRAVLALCEAHIAQQPENIITRLHERWGG